MTEQNKFYGSLSIKNARLVDPSQNIDSVLDIHCQNGRIAALGAAPSGWLADHELVVDGLLACPGIVDLNHFLREPGYEQKGTLKTELSAAVASGITTVCAQPNTKPVIDSEAVVKLINGRVGSVNLCKVDLIGALTDGLQGNQLSEMYTLKEMGCIGVTNGLQSVANNQVLRQALYYAKTHDLTVFFAPMDEALSEHGLVHDGKVSASLGLSGIPKTAETIALARDLLLVEEIGIKAHFTRLTTAQSVQMIARAKAQQLPVSADVSIHHLLLSEDDIEPFDSQYHIIPPLRERADQQALLAGLLNGDIDAISSGHEPHQMSAKNVPFPESLPGISTADIFFGLVCALTETTQIGVGDLVQFLSCNPGRILNKDYGSLRIGASADICIFDPNYRWQVNSEKFSSKGKNTPYQGKSLKGKVKFTIVNGQIVYTLS